MSEYKDGRKKDESKMEENTARKTKGNIGKENHQGQVTKEEETKTPFPSRRQ